MRDNDTGRTNLTSFELTLSLICFVKGVITPSSLGLYPFLPILIPDWEVVETMPLLGGAESASIVSLDRFSQRENVWFSSNRDLSGLKENLLPSCNLPGICELKSKTSRACLQPQKGLPFLVLSVRWASLCWSKSFCF